MLRAGPPMAGLLVGTTGIGAALLVDAASFAVMSRLSFRLPDLPLPSRPPGVEGFLPISGLMGLLDWIYQGALNTIHPAATILFVLFLAMSVVFVWRLNASYWKDVK